MMPRYPIAPWPKYKYLLLKPHDHVLRLKPTSSARFFFARTNFATRSQIKQDIVGGLYIKYKRSTTHLHPQKLEGKTTESKRIKVRNTNWTKVWYKFLLGIVMWVEWYESSPYSSIKTLASSIGQANLPWKRKNAIYDIALNGKAQIVYIVYGLGELCSDTIYGHRIEISIIYKVVAENVLFLPGVFWYDLHS